MTISRQSCSKLNASTIPTQFRTVHNVLRTPLRYYSRTWLAFRNRGSKTFINLRKCSRTARLGGVSLGLLGFSFVRRHHASCEYKPKKSRVLEESDDTADEPQFSWSELWKLLWPDIWYLVGAVIVSCFATSLLTI